MRRKIKNYPNENSKKKKTFYIYLFVRIVFCLQAKKSPTDDNEIQLTSTKENLKSFIERWEEHPNSPYIFDANSSLILPIQDNEKNTSSGFSSRGCSPSPCESLSSNTELFQNGMSPDSAVPNNSDLDNNNDFDANTTETEHNEQKDSGTASATMATSPAATAAASASAFERPNSSASVDRRRTKTKQEYLQSFDRRHSDSNYVINQSSSSLEKLNLAEEIKKLSERLMVLSSISDELMEFNKRYEENQKQKSTANTDDATTTKVQTNRSSEALKNMKNASSFNCSTKTEKISNKLVHSKSLLSENEIQAAAATTSTAATAAVKQSTKTSAVVNDLTERLRTLNEIPCVFEQVINGNNSANGIETGMRTASFPIGMQRLKSTSVSTDSSNSTSPCTIGSVPWPKTNRRTKFRITQLSRDVPYGSPDSHRTIFLEEAANTTKDCLLQLLDKYNDKKETRICSIRRHQSIAVGNGMTDNLEYHSMNSINTFFKRNVFQQNGNTVRKIKARIESKH